MTVLNQIDIAIFVMGLALVMAWIAATTYQRAWSSVLSAPAVPAHQLTAFDILFASWIFLAGRGMGGQLAVALVAAGSGSVAATQPAADELLTREIGMALGAILSVGVFLVIAAARLQGGPGAWRLATGARPRYLLLSLAVTIAALGVCNVMFIASELLLRMILEHPPAEHEKILLLQRDDTPQSLVVLTVVGAVIVAPLLEEMFFRGLLLPALVKWFGSAKWAVVVSAVLFGVIHLSVPATVAPLTLFGMILGAVYLRTGTLMAPLVIHALFNARTVIWILLSGEK